MSLLSSRTMTPPQSTMKNKDLYQIVPFKKFPNTKAWKLTSEYVRRKSRTYRADWLKGVKPPEGTGICYTCYALMPLNKLVAGHFREKRGNASIYFDLRGIRAQCYRCNRILHGNYGVFMLRLLDEIGRKEIDDLIKKSQKPKQWTRAELLKIEKSLEQELKKIK